MVIFPSPLAGEGGENSLNFRRERGKFPLSLTKIALRNFRLSLSLKGRELFANFLLFLTAC